MADALSSEQGLLFIVPARCGLEADVDTDALRFSNRRPGEQFPRGAFSLQHMNQLEPHRREGEARVWPSALAFAGLLSAMGCKPAADDCPKYRLTARRR